MVEPQKKQSKADRRLSAEQELAMLENDAQLNVLLDRIEEGESLGSGLQKYVDEKLARIEVLMKQLGIYDEDESEQEEHTEQTSSRELGSDDDLLSQFEDLDLDQFKG